MGGHPLRSPTRRRLGRPLPCQLADGPQAPPKAARLLAPLERGSRTPRTVCGISSPFGLLFPTSGQVTYVLRTHSPLSRPLRADCVRLACLKHAASVHPEPGSNSPYELLRRFSPKTKSSGDRSCERLAETRHSDRTADTSAIRPSFLPLVLLPITLQLLRCTAPLFPAPERRATLPHPRPLRQGRRKTDATITPLHRPRGVRSMRLSGFTRQPRGLDFTTATL